MEAKCFTVNFITQHSVLLFTFFSLIHDGFLVVRIIFFGGYYYRNFWSNYILESTTLSVIYSFPADYEVEGKGELAFAESLLCSRHMLSYVPVPVVKHCPLSVVHWYCQFRSKT